MVAKVASFVIFVMLTVDLLVAQNTGFTGSFTLNTHQIDANGNKANERNLPLLISPERVRINDLNRLDPTPVTNNLGARDMIIRLDVEDFVFLTADQQGIVVKKQELQSMMNLMMGNRGNTTTLQPEIESRRTSETKSINGYTANKWVVKEKGSDTENHVWVSDEFNINWGMLTEPWVSGLPGVGLLPVGDMLTGGKTPLLVETIRNGAVVAIVQVGDINPNINYALLNVPNGTKLMTIQEMMLNRMRNF
jgi:hypothetical protein